MLFKEALPAVKQIILAMVLKSLGVAVVVFMTISYNAQKEMIVMIMALQKQV